MAERECTFELWCRGEMVESFTGPRSEAKAQAEARLHGYKMSDLAFVREARASGTARIRSGGWASLKALVTMLFYAAAALFFIWIEFF